MGDTPYDIAVVGGGTAGLVTAAGAAALGARVALIERARLGGEWPDALAWIRAARERVGRHDSPERFRGLGVHTVFGPARLAGPQRVVVDGRVLRAHRLVITTGASPVAPPIPGLADVGYLTYETALELPTLPSSVVMLGGGPIGLEFAQLLARFGVAVTVLEAMSEVLPREDPEAGRLIRARLTVEGVTMRTGVSVVRAAREGAETALYTASGERFAAAALFVASGRRPNVRDLELERAGVEVEGGGVRVNHRLETTQAGIWAAGDVTGGRQFTHLADYMARAVVQNALTPLKAAADYRAVPAVTFTDPEVASVGLTMEQAQAADPRSEAYRYEFADLDRAIVDRADVGFCKVVTRRNGRILGATIVGRGAGELITVLSLAMRHRIPLPHLARHVFPYPTMSEAIRRAADAWYRSKYGATARGRILRRLVQWWL
ncbi:MAG: FAD-dependent oxidoreductase, partial [Gemmatimonadetes bacterium]|nr:FAD-dependent oxidoreductase [Gemmatimonadota bacterium]